MVKARKYVVKKYSEGLPKRTDFEIVEYELPPLKNGDILVKAEWVSVDPSQRNSNDMYPLPYDQLSYQVGLVIESKNPKYPVGTRVVSYKGWCDYYIRNSDEDNVDPKKVTPEMFYKLPDLHGLSNSLAVGAVGMPGATAYFGFLELCAPKAGETVVVTAAAGAVGHLVGQIAKIKGCRVIGFAGSDDKVEWLEKDIGFDKVINYKTAYLAKQLKEAAPNGIDCYFDNVGGELSTIIMNQMNLDGRVSVCGNIGVVNELGEQKAGVVQTAILYKRLRIQGFHAYTWAPRWTEALTALAGWIRSGQLKVREHITEGFENIFDAYVGMLKGANTGKAVVKI